MNEKLFGLKIRNKLNAGNARLDPHITERLFAARQIALQRHSSHRQGFSLVGRGGLLGHLRGEYFAPLASALALIVVVAVGDHWMSYQRAAELEEIDSALLADDLPITAYLDRGFDAWLSTSD